MTAARTTPDSRIGRHRAPTLPSTTASDGNGHGDASELTALRVASSVLASRATLARQVGKAFGGNRDYYDALGYPENITLVQYRQQYNRGGIAHRIVEAYPRAAWTGGAMVVENPKPNVTTEFEKQTESLFRRLNVWKKLLDADILAALGHYSILLIGVAGEAGKILSDELEGGLSSTDDIIYLTPLPETRATITGLVDNASDPRFGQPVSYKVKISDKMSEQFVHPSRVIHIPAQGGLENDIYGPPSLESVWNLLMDLEKIEGGMAEAVWRTVYGGVHFDFSIPDNPDLQVDAPELAKMQTQIDEYMYGMRRDFMTRYGKVTPLNTTVPDTEGNANTILKLIATTKSMPQRILAGSESAQRASEQDDKHFNDQVDAYQANHCTPVTRNFIDRLTGWDALAEPGSDGYNINWSERDELTLAQKASTARLFAVANKAQVESTGQPILTSDEIRADLLGYGTLDDVVTIAPAALNVDVPSDVAEWQAIHRVADRHLPTFEQSMIDTWSAVELNETGITSAIERDSTGKSAGDIVAAAVELAMGDVVPDLVSDTLTDGAKTSLQSIQSRGSWLRPSSSVIGRVLNKLRPAVLRPAQLETTFDATNPRAVEWAATRSSQLITEIGTSTRQAVQQFVASGLELGRAPRLLARDIRQIVGLRSDQVITLNTFMSGLGDGVTLDDPRSVRRAAQLRQARALLIARTESSISANQGLIELWKQARDDGQLPDGIEREWIITPDERLRDEHAAMAGQRRGLDESFESPSGALIEPGQEPNCRCSQGLVRG